MEGLHLTASAIAGWPMSAPKPEQDRPHSFKHWVKHLDTEERDLDLQ
jgi:hypothetical protein